MANSYDKRKNMNLLQLGIFRKEIVTSSFRFAMLKKQSFSKFQHRLTSRATSPPFHNPQPSKGAQMQVEVIFKLFLSLTT